MSNEIKRMHYFNGLLLKEEDLTLDQEYHKKLQRMHNRYFHDWGIVDGLEVKKLDGTSKIEVAPGLAINRIANADKSEKYSQEIWITKDHPDKTIDLALYSEGQSIYIYVNYEEELVDVDTKKGGDNKIHILERARICHTPDKPNPESEDITKNIYLARVVLTKSNGIKVIDKVSYFYDEEEKIALRTYAVTQGTAREFEKISIGEKDKLNLPYIEGLVDDSIGKGRGLEIHSPFTKISNKLAAGSVTTGGDVDVNGILTVKTNDKEVFKVDDKGAVSISKTAAVDGLLLAKGGISVSGTDTTIGTQNVTLTTNMLTLNKQTPKNGDTSIQNVNSGIQVYRPDTNALLAWDENKRAWMAGTVENKDIPGSGLSQLAYGTAWEEISKGSNADLYHKHSKIYTDQNLVALSTDSQGNITVLGKVLAKEGLQVTRDGNKKPAAKLLWDEASERWKVGLEDKMFEIPYGDTWTELISKKNADDLHTHSEFYYNDKDLAMNAGPTGDINIKHNLVVGENVTIVGDLDVKGKTTEYKNTAEVVTNNVIIVNKPSDGSKPITDGGMEVYRGENLPNARIIWDEDCDRWKVGTGDSLAEIPSYGIEWEKLTHSGDSDNLHLHKKLSGEDGTIGISVDSIQEDEKKNKYANVSVNGNLDVVKDTKLKGDLSVKGSMVVDGDFIVNGNKTTINEKNLEVENNVIVVNKYSTDCDVPPNEAGIEVNRGSTRPNASIMWNEGEGVWKVSTGLTTSDLAYGKKWEDLTQKALADRLHKHSVISDKDGKAVLFVDNNGKLNAEKDSYFKGDLTVDGPVTIKGKLNVEGDPTFIEKESIKVKDNYMLLNNYEGDTSPNNESGLHIYRGKTASEARLVWDEEEKVWKAGVGEELKSLAYGKEWDGLKDSGNADDLHKHSQLYNLEGDIKSLSTRATGSVEIFHDLNVGQDVNVDGNLDIRGQLTRIASSNVEFIGNSIVLNKVDTTTVPEVESSVNVFRGDNVKNAAIAWDEKNDYWKIGLVSNTTAPDVFRVYANGNVQAPSGVIDGELKAGSINVKGTSVIPNGLEIYRINESDARIAWNEELKRWEMGTKENTGLSVYKDGKVGIKIGKNTTPKEALDVNGNAFIGGDIKIAGNANVDGKLTFQNADFKGSFNIDNLNVNGKGIVIDQSGKEKDGKPLQNAMIKWDDTNQEWLFGTADKLVPISQSGQHKHNEIFAKGVEIVSVFADSNGNVGIGTTQPKSKLDVIGNTTINGTAEINTLNVKGDATFKKIITDGSIGAAGTTAQIFWNNTQKKWKATIDGQNAEDAKEICLGDHTHHYLNKLNSKPEDKPEIFINTGGNVGVGTTDPRAKLDVAGNIKAGSINVQGSVESGATIKGNDADIASVLKANSAAITTDLSVGGNLTVNGQVLTVLKTEVSVEDNIITVNKYVDRPTPLPQDAGLEVFRGGAANNPNAQIIWDEKEDVWKFGTSTDLKLIEYQGHKHSELTTLAGALTVNSGNVGIGVAEPKNKLDVSGNSSITGKLWVNEASVTKGLAVGELTVGTNVIKTDSNGNVGIGVSGVIAPTNKLEVGGNSSITGKLWVNEANVTKGLAVGELTVGTNVIKTDASGNVGIGISAPTNKLEVGGNSSITGTLTVGTNVITTDANGNVGIGKTPEAPEKGIKLDVGGNSSITGTLTVGTNVITTDANGNVGIGKTPEAPEKGIKLDVGGNSQITGTLWANAANITKDLSVTGKLTGGTLTVGTNVIKTDSNGNVGIGVSGVIAPTNKLEVGGNSSITGTLTVGTNVITTDANGNVGIGKTPEAPEKGIKLDVGGNSQITGTLWANAANITKDLSVTGKLTVGTNVITTDANGNVVIGKDTDTGVKLTVNGDIKATNFIGNVKASTLAQGSSRTYKENIEKLPVKTAMELLNKLNPVAFDYKENDSKKHNIGFIAEDVPEIFTTSDRKAVALMDIIGVLTAVVKKQQKETTTLQKQISELQKQVTAFMGA